MNPLPTYRWVDSAQYCFGQSSTMCANNRRRSAQSETSATYPWFEWTWSKNDEKRSTITIIWINFFFSLICLICALFFSQNYFLRSEVQLDSFLPRSVPIPAVSIFPQYYLFPPTHIHWVGCMCKERPAHFSLFHTSISARTLSI